MGGYHHDKAARLLAQVGAHPDADPAPLAQAARDAHGDLHAGVMVGPDGTIQAHTIRDARGTHRIHETGAEWAADLWAARQRRRIGPTVHVPLWRVFSGPA